ncbi:ABC transporter substrate-binding protein [Pararhodobacter oceanensis]|uniref:Branched-chain amino acid ABC transporter substrate-binding protein n=1 Tax=Pararhodobacter oceanensis TaxID=2172121 RepID=A0A2T8HSL9_9RHOB|nr:ABC transporter substrate-binding protein [Pararhodobacter oceanensis]PVH28440.1 branched-chain amino acid ABC transporter substrate-binding protein [Pararhodobacter oceanensis]
MKKLTTLMAAAAATTLAVGAQAQTRGVTDDEIRIGGVHDLSGVFAAVSTPAVSGANLYFDMVNENGGVHGRMINYMTEDHGYQLPRATQAYNKLIERDQVFAMLLNLGTPHNLAHYPLMERRGVPNVAPLTAARAILPDPPLMNFSSFSSYYDQIAQGIEYLHNENGRDTVCAMYLPTDFGEEIAISSRETAEALGLTFADETTHRPDDQDFVGSVSRLRAAECDIVTIALGVRASITVVGTAKQLGWDDVDFLVSSAGFLEPVAMVPGGVTDGLYGASGWQDLRARATEEAPAAFIAAYEERYGQPASGFAMLGYTAAQQMVMALEAAGPDLTVESFMDGMHSLDYDDALLGTHVNFTPEDHQGANDVFISQVGDGHWNTLATISGE